jgi:DNA polymerase-3 subunit delta'
MAFGEERKLPHPDIHLCHLEGKVGMHSIGALRTLLEEAHLAPFEAKRKCFLIFEAERMLASSSNALLKVLEEPPAKTLFFLLTSYHEKILPTIASRCQTLFFPEKKREVTRLQHSFLQLLAGETDLDALLALLEENKKRVEEGLHESLPQEITPSQKELYEREIDGQSALHFQEEFLSLLATLIEWHRDLFLLDLDVEPSHLFFKERTLVLKGRAHPSWNQVNQAIRDAQEALIRNIAPKTILESTLLRLGH